MKITRQQRLQGETYPPFYYGLAYRNWFGDVDIYYVIPFNYVMRLFRTCSYYWNKFRSREHWVDTIIYEKVNERGNRYRRAYYKELERLKEKEIAIRYLEAKTKYLEEVRLAEDKGDKN